MKILRTFGMGCLAIALATCHLHAAPKKAAAPTPPAAAPAKAAPPAPGDPQAGKPAGFSLEAAEVTTTGFTHVLKDGTKQTLTVTDKTVITNNGAPAKLADIKPGDVVNGSRVKVGENEYHLVKITKFAPKPPKETKPKAEPKK